MYFSIDGTAGFGQVGINELGYETECSNKIIPPRTDPNFFMSYTCVSAHAPSFLKLTLTRPANVFGFLNASARLDKGNPVEFWIDYNYQGQAQGPCDAGREVTLDIGEHVLQAIPIRSERDFRHSVWAIKPMLSSGEAGKFGDRVCINRTALMTVAAYPPDRVPRNIAHLAYTASKFMIPLFVCGVAEEYNHYHTKIERLRTWIERLPEYYESVLFVDGRDVLLGNSLEMIQHSFRTFSSPIVIGAEAGCWPVFDNDWVQKHPAHPENRRWINSGMIMGERNAMIDALERMIRLHCEFSRDTPTKELNDLWRWRHMRYDDQFLWQVCELKNLFPLKVDRDCVLFANITTQDPKLVNSVDYILDRDNRTVTMKANGNMPSIFHFSGDGASRYMHQWAGYLQLVAPW